MSATPPHQRQATAPAAAPPHPPPGARRPRAPQPPALNCRCAAFVSPDGRIGLNDRLGRWNRFVYGGAGGAGVGSGVGRAARMWAGAVGGAAETMSPASVTGAAGMHYRPPPRTDYQSAVYLQLSLFWEAIWFAVENLI